MRNKDTMALPELISYLGAAIINLSAASVLPELHMVLRVLACLDIGWALIMLDKDI